MINIVKDIDPINKTDDYDVILVGTNTYGKLANGWQLDMKIKYPQIHKANLSTKYGDTSKVGKYLTIGESPTICLLYINKGYNFRPDLDPVFLEYDALEECLYRINIEFKGKRVLAPILGSSKFDGNGDKKKIIEIFERLCTNLDVTLYDYEQISAREKTLKRIKSIMNAKSKAKETNDKTEYYKLISEKKEEEKKLKEINRLINI